MVVVFPAPFRPRSPNARPLSAVIDMPRSTSLSPNDFSRFFNSRRMFSLSFYGSFPLFAVPRGYRILPQRCQRITNDFSIFMPLSAKTKAIPHNSARAICERFFAESRKKAAAILCVWQGLMTQSRRKRSAKRRRRYCAVLPKISYGTANVQDTKRATAIFPHLGHSMAHQHCAGAPRRDRCRMLRIEPTASGYFRAFFRALMSSEVVAQLVAKRMIVWVSSYFSQKPNSAFSASCFISLFSMMQKT